MLASPDIKLGICINWTTCFGSPSGEVTADGMPSQDQRILQAMAHKLATQQEQEEVRKMAAKVWHEEALLDQTSKQIEERQHREYLVEHNKAVQQQVSNLWNPLGWP